MKVIKLELCEQIPNNFTGLVEKEATGTKEYYKEGKLHRIDEPAVEWFDGTKLWFIEGKKHRIDGAAVEFHKGLKHWYVNDCLYLPETLVGLFDRSIFLGKEKGKYDLEWLRFLTENEGIYEFPLIPGMLDYWLSTKPILHKK